MKIVYSILAGVGAYFILKNLGIHGEAMRLLGQSVSIAMVFASITSWFTFHALRR